MSKVIIYNQESGIPAILYPASEFVAEFGIEAIARKDVPAGKKFKIVDESELPYDWPQEAWEIDESELTDGVGSETNLFEDSK